MAAVAAWSTRSAGRAGSARTTRTTRTALRRLRAAAAVLRVAVGARDRHADRALSGHQRSPVVLRRVAEEVVELVGDAALGVLHGHLLPRQAPGES
ncbi:hypothetical protein ACFQ9X_55670 [Catenulispora yoronensis]